METETWFESKLMFVNVDIMIGYYGTVEERVTLALSL